MEAVMVMRKRLAPFLIFATIISIAPAEAARHGGFGTLPIGKIVTVKCFTASGMVYERIGWFLASVGSNPDNIILSEDLKDPDNSKTAVITLSGRWDCVIETM